MQKELIRLIQKGKKVFLVGIGGIGMSGLARILTAHGLEVSGSDAKRGRMFGQLESEGIHVAFGHDTTSIEGQDWAIYSSAISKTNPEFTKAEALGIPMFHRAEVLSFLMNQVISLAVTGAHGKTTSSALTSFLMTEAGLRPTCVVGGEILNYASNVVVGDPHLFVAEVDESDRSQLHFYPDFALITNLDSEHLDVYQDLDDIKRSFRTFIDQVKTTGQVIYCAEDPNLNEIAAQAPSGATSYGLLDSADFSAKEIVVDGFRSTYTLVERGKEIDKVHLSIPGLHNVLNSLGVIALLRSFGLSYDQFLALIPKFRGTGRRLEIKLDRKELLVVDDYAHHPTEVSATLRALRSLGKRVTAVFQPHRFSRTRHLANEFSHAFDHADRVLLTDIYSAGEDNPNQVDSSLIYESVKRGGHPCVEYLKRSDIVDFLLSENHSEAVIAFLGAGDIGEIANEFATRFESAYSH